MKHELIKYIPPEGIEAADLLLDVVVSCTVENVADADLNATVALMESLIHAEAAGDDEIALEHVERHTTTVGASSICIGWLAAQLADATNTDLLTIISNLRTFIISKGQVL